MNTTRRRLYLMRHASVSYFDELGRPLNPLEVTLTNTGIDQAKAAGLCLSDVKFDLAVCSGLNRTRQTALLVLGQQELMLEEEPGFKEIRAGRLREIPTEDLEQEMAYPYEQAWIRGKCFLGGETYSSFRVRVLAAWNNFLANDWKHALLVAHDAVNRLLLEYIVHGAPFSSMSAFEQDPACINIIDIDVDQGSLKRMLLRTVNYTPYDPIKQQLRLTVMEDIHQLYKKRGVQ